jgi:4-hydroxy-3-methylbut-2-en-1-yl diphosphate reductase
VIAKLKSLGAASVRELDGITENIVFPLPKGLGAGVALGAERTS